MATPEAFVALQTQVAEMATTQQRLLDQNAELQRQLVARATADPWAASREAAATGQAMPTQFNPNANYGNLIKPPQFNFGKQCCPEAFNGKPKAGFKDYAFKMANFIAMTAVSYRHVKSILDWAAKEDAPILTEEFDQQASSGGWLGSGNDHKEFSTNSWGLLTNKTEGDALNCIRNVEKGHGVEAWRKLHAEYRPSSSTQAMGYMLKILTQPQATSSETATASLNQYEEHIRAYEECGEKYRLEEVVKLSRLKMIMPAKVQEFVALKAPSECS